MNGSNSLEESEKKPMSLCPVCLRKLQSNIQFDILERYKKIYEWVAKREDERGNQLLNYLREVIESIDKILKW